MPMNLKLVDCFMTILCIVMFTLCLTLVRWNTINFVLYKIKDQHITAKPVIY